MPSNDRPSATFASCAIAERVLPLLLRVWRRLPGPLKLVYLYLRYTRHAVGVAALIRDERGRVLIVHRTYSIEEPWALPGGWLEGRGCSASDGSAGSSAALRS